jgi:type I restriction enzyme S subunit
MKKTATYTKKRHTYPAYKDSGIEWLGEIPKHWEVKRLRFIAKIQTGNTPSKTEEDNYSDEGLLWVKPDNLFGPKPITSTKEYLSKTGREKARVIPSGNPLICCIGTIGKWGYSPQPVATNQQINAVVFNASVVNRKFCIYLIASSEEEHWRRANTNVVSILNSEQQSNIPYPLPPLPEQRAIAAFLDRETARIDGLIEKKQRQIELLQEKRAALISHAVTKGLNPNAKMKDSGIEWLGEIPEGWDAVRVRHATNYIEQGWSPQCESREADLDEWGVMKAGCANHGRFNEREHKVLPHDVLPERAYEIKPGDVIMSRACGTLSLVGSVAFVETCRPRLLLCDKLFRLHPSPKRCLNQFLYLSLNSRLARAQIEMCISGAGGLANNVTQPTIKNIIIALPPLGEQEIIVQHVRRFISRLNTLISKVELSIERLFEYRKALVLASVTGKIDVRKETV